MSRVSVALVIAVAALLVSCVANVVAFTRPAAEIRDGSVEVADLTPDAREHLRGERGEPGARGPRGLRGPAGPPSIGLPGRPGKDAPDVSDQVESLEEIVWNLCGDWVYIKEDVSDREYWRKIC
jgi:hypothetical protein